MKRSLLLSTAALGVAILPLGAVQAQAPTPFDNPGLYFGPYAGVATDMFHSDDGGGAVLGTLDAFVGGFIVGDRFKRQPGQIWSAAVEGEIGFVGKGNQNVHDQQVELLQDNNVDICGYDQNAVGRVRFLAGLPGSNIEPFGAIGVAVTNADVCYENLVAGGTYVGLTLGAGANIALGPNFFVRPEVLYDIYGKKNYEDFSVGLQTLTARVAAVFRFPAPR